MASQLQASKYEPHTCQSVATVGELMRAVSHACMDGGGLERRAKHESGRLRMAWTLQGTYFENCSCDTICPCTWSGLTAKATHDRCKAMLAFHIDRGEIEGVDVSGLTFALVADTPPVMSDGNWK